MNMATLEAKAIAGAYLAMARVFSYPDEESWQRLNEQGLVDPDCTRDTLEAEYLAAFEVGRESSPVPLFEGMHRPDAGRDGILEELLRYYDFFDAKLSETEREYPDHLATELEFLAWLCIREQAAAESGHDAEPFRRAARDFIERHVGAWAPEFHRKLKATDTAYSEYGAALVDLVRRHQALLGESMNDREV